MSLIGIIVSAGVMSIVSAYMLFKLKEGDQENSLGNGLQVLFFFMVLAGFIIMGSAGYQSRNDCDYLLTNVTTVNSSLTTNSYDYVCTERVTGAASWVYRLPVWLAGASALYLVYYLLMLIVNVINYYRKGGDRG